MAEPSLTHVCMWSEHGWKRITAVEAARLHPGGTVSARSGLFMCELCGQYVGLSDGRERVRYFYHSAHEAIKDCPERTFGPQVAVDYVAGEHELPLRLVITSPTSFSLELGLIYIPRDLLNKYQIQQITIKPNGPVGSFVYSIERLNAEGITYLPMGNVPCGEYEILSCCELERFWPQKVKGISQSGAIFDSATGKKLTNDADVRVGRSYYLLTRSLNLFHPSSVIFKTVCQKRADFGSWFVHEITATQFDERSARFFLNLHCRLTDVPISLQPLWPLYVKSPYVIKHAEDTIYVFVSGQNSPTIKSFPDARRRHFPCANDMGQLVEITCNGRQQLISTGRTNVLDYTYLWKDPLDSVAAQPTVSVCDIKQNAIKPGPHGELPPKGTLYITAPYDGLVIVRAHQKTIEERGLSADTEAEINDIKSGYEISIYQGLDCVFSVSFSRGINVSDANEQAILKKLRASAGTMVPVNHQLRAAAQRLSGYPRVQAWIRSQIKSGYISQPAFSYIKHLARKP